MIDTSNAWGATPGEWAHFSQRLGLVEHLLPVVSNPTAIISSRSSMQSLGKTPSLYNDEHRVVGIGNWTSLHPTEAKVERWSRQSDYGICVQTREVRAFDIDVADVDAARSIEMFIGGHLMLDLPARRRANSGKCLLAVRVVSEALGKRTIPVAGGVIEFLGTGNQFIACGTHPTGVRYEWDGGVPAEIPELTVVEFEDLWVALRTRFAVGESTEGAVSIRRRGESIAVDDPVARHLEASGQALEGSDDVRVVVKCPWEDGHSSGTTGDTSSVWFRAGSNGYGIGHYRCLHATCAGRTDGAFMAEVGYSEPAVVFAPVELTEGEDEGGDEDEPQGLVYQRGRAVATIENVVKALRKPGFCGMQLRFDTFRDEIMMAEPRGDQWLQFTDYHYTVLRITLGDRRRFQPVGRELIRDAVLLVASENKFDTAIEWLDRLTWDGVPRVEQFLTTYFGVNDSAYARAVSRYTWTAMAGRVLVPGIKADMMPVLIGDQGARKSTAVQMMVPDIEFFAEMQFDEADADLARKMRGRLIAEFGELKGLHSKEAESIKSFITRTHENWIPKYREFGTTFARRLVFIGTTNDEEFLSDQTGNRRWLPVKVGSKVDSDGVRDNMPQLWAEAAEIFLLNGVEFRKAEELAKKVHREHMITDPWQSAIEDWLNRKDAFNDTLPRTRSFLLTSDVLVNALNFDAKHVKRYEEMRVGKVLQALNYKRTKVRIGTVLRWGYVPICS